ncbi:Terminal ear1-like 1 protein [Thalictrum thalictroides]|uniref:Terminal ear1-like 1 protein n=1 Tax=Thalictrum thalictroides TaxID=46969 RepID=A0A7J6VNF9_THATH|nr:Terminal ear1-like 1 protein [Thalictrum thalictroides]
MKWVPKILAFSSEPIHPEGNKTSVMIKNIPNKFTRENLVAWLDNFCKGENQKLHFGDLENKRLAYDFVYLPIDFNSKCNKGYAFVNFNKPIGAWKLYKEFHDAKWDIFCSKKICDITYARIQGKEGLVNHFDKSTFICETDEYLPTYFEPCRDGYGKWVKQCTVGRRIYPVSAISSNKGSHHGDCKPHSSSMA